MSDVKHVNPYRPTSSYHVAFAILQKKQVIAVPEWIKLVAEATGKDLEHAAYDVNVVRSPTEDNWGSRSASSEGYFCQSCERKIVNGVKEPIKEKLRWRTEEMVNPYAKAKNAKAVKTVKVEAEKTKVVAKAKKVVAKKAVKKAKVTIVEVASAPVVTPEATPVSTIAPEVIA